MNKFTFDSQIQSYRFFPQHLTNLTVLKTDFVFLVLAHLQGCSRETQ